MGLVVGIDLGTTNSAVAVIDSNGRPVIVTNSYGKPITPSIICFRGANDIVVGDDAKELQGLGEYPTASFFKREMGDESFFLEFYGKRYSATELSTILLKKLKKDAEDDLGAKITDAVITVPAYYGEKQRKATINAAEAAGLNILQVINEPTAAAIAYGFDGKQQIGKKLLIYDLGGGTFDVTLAEITSDGIRVIASEGNHRLGGKDWDDRIISFLATRFEEEYGTNPLDEDETVAELQLEAENAKRKLTNVNQVKISIVCDGNRGRYELTRDKFNEITEGLMYLTVSLTKNVLEDAGFDKNSIDGVLLVGGSTRMPMVHEFIKKEFGKSPLTGVNVDEAVALGAAIVATKIVSARNPSKKENTFFLSGSRTNVLDVTSHSLGIIKYSKKKGAYINSIVLAKNTIIPCTASKSIKVQTNANQENTHEIYLTEGEGESPETVNYLALYVVHDIPHSTDQTKIDVSYRCDTNGTVQVSAKVNGTNQSLRVTQEVLPNDVPARFASSPTTSPASQVSKVTAPPTPQPAVTTTQTPHWTNIYLLIDISDKYTLEQERQAIIEFINRLNSCYLSMNYIAFLNASILYGSIYEKILSSDNKHNYYSWWSAWMHPPYRFNTESLIYQINEFIENYSQLFEFREKQCSRFKGTDYFDRFKENFCALYHGHQHIYLSNQRISLDLFNRLDFENKRINQEWNKKYQIIVNSRDYKMMGHETYVKFHFPAPSDGWTYNPPDITDLYYKWLMETAGSKKSIALIIVGTPWDDPTKVISGINGCKKNGIEFIVVGFGKASESFMKSISSNDRYIYVKDVSDLGTALDKIIPWLDIYELTLG